MRTIVTVVTITLLALVAVAVAAATNIWFGLAFFTLSVGGFVVHSFRQIPAQPPTRGVLTFIGRRVEPTLNEGFIFLPFYPWLFGFVPVPITKINLDLKDQKVRTPDMAELLASVSITYTPDEAHLIEFLNSGGKDGVDNILEDVVRERLRLWMIAPHEGPVDWESAVKTPDQATAIIVQHVTGIAQPDPDLVGRLRRGNAVQAIPQLGIMLNRLNVTDIVPTGTLATAAELMAKERRDQVGETVELQHISQRVAALRTELGITTQEAINLVQTERDKVVRTIDEKRVSLSPETAQVLPEALARIFGPRQGGQL
ncbi:MAG: hypothetical protein HYW37_01615 [Candidatus Colwellbacteria bacterium]|nr:hypothetical protein [Candidatus Colwellbacteria bacterium]